MLLISFFLFEQELIPYFFSETKTGFDVDETSLEGRDDIEGLDASAAHVANLLSSEPSDGTIFWLYMITVKQRISHKQSSTKRD
jgi:hypothetical protein